MVVNSSYVQALISIIRIVAQDSSTCQDSTVNHCMTRLLSTEAAHQYLNKRLLRSNYRVKDIESHAHGLKLYRCVLHMNAYNVLTNKFSLKNQYKYVWDSHIIGGSDARLRGAKCW